MSEELDNSLTIYPQADGKPFFVFTGVWGNLFCVNAEGKLRRKHLFRSKNRGVPLVLDANGDGNSDIVQATYMQHVLAFGADGRLVDDLRLNGLANPILRPLRKANRQADCLQPAPASTDSHTRNP